MARVLRYIEYFLGRLLYNVKGHDSLLFTKQEPFKAIPRNIDVVAPEIGPEGAQMGNEYSMFGGSKFPELTWSLAPQAGSSILAKDEIKEYILICEDPDAPIPNMVSLHGIYYSIPPEKTHVASDDISLDSTVSVKSANHDNGARNKAKWLKGGFRLGKNALGTVYGGARPPVGHGGHRYFYQIVALKEKLDTSRLSPVATKPEILDEIRGKVVGWGFWYGVYENKW
ncbi:uncharacterized protein A1O9_12507 [Exophiala aquamarina CBS 119918]|uniref:Phosphatidylethanolamine-binding protein n=1 Tax=Exophiala aquamarina CBS 119918 TaxID=1182545 RepID=A0A072NWG0_9EURO|nr:uncharacterized protein A1O9_12507 [Exophiala aquamarina CBS 119918]KEF51358.1 hypothetical protein A1O9_12507 [Exophiala aquamarina CBS 119918]